jgi:hypothetical protein
MKEIYKDIIFVLGLFAPLFLAVIFLITALILVNFNLTIAQIFFWVGTILFFGYMAVLCAKGIEESVSEDNNRR